MEWEHLVDWEQSSWQEAEAVLSRVQDQMGLRIDAGILAPVVGLNLLGFHTSASCEGHLNWGCPYPWIEFFQEVEDPDYMQACDLASNPDLAPQEKPVAEQQMRAKLVQFAQADPLYQALGALLAEYTRARQASDLKDDQTIILLAPFAPGWYRLLAAGPAWWQRWEESERAEQTDWWQQTPTHEQQRRLSRAQAEMAAFTAFLKARWMACARPEALRV